MSTHPPDTFTDHLLPAMTSLRGLARVYLRNEADAEDAHACALERAWRFADRFDPEIGSPHAWCATILRHECVRIIHSRPRCTYVEPEVLERLAGDAFDIEATIDARRLRSRRSAWLLEQVAELPDVFREAIEDDIDGLGCVESAAARGTNVNTIHGRRYRGRERLMAARSAA